MGYTTVITPAMPPLEARHTHEELNDTPMIDKACFPLLGDWWFVLEHLRDGELKECASHVAWMLRATKGYAIKIVNPGGPEMWGFGRNVKSIYDQIPPFNITPRDIVRGLCKVNRILNLPHTIHVHTNNLGKPGNYSTTIDTLRCVRNLARDDRPVIHITHCQFSAFTGSDWMNMGSGADKIAKYINHHTHATIDMGQVVFADTTTMTADGPFQYGLYGLTGNKWVNHDVETETGAGIVPFRYRRTSYVHAMQWSIGLELALLIEDPWKVYLTTDHPNAAPFTTYPRIIAWLMSREAREKMIRRINRKARRKSLLRSIDREYGLYDVAIATRAGQVKALGLKQKGHLGVGADADVAIYRLDPRETDLSKNPELVRKAFEEAAYTIKDGVVVVKDGKVVKPVSGRTYWMDVETTSDFKATSELKQKFKDYWTVEYENYPIPEDYLLRSQRVMTKAGI